MIVLRSEIVDMIKKGNLARLMNPEDGLQKFYRSKAKVSDTIYPAYTIPTLLARYDIEQAVPVLVKLRVDMTKPDEEGYSPALAAAGQGSLKFLKALHEAGIDILAPVNRRTVFDVARNDATRQFITSLTKSKPATPHLENALT